MDPRFAYVTLFLHLLSLLGAQKSGAARILNNEKLSKISNGDHKGTNPLQLHSFDVGQENARSRDVKLHDVEQHTGDNQFWIYAKKDAVVDNQIWIHDKKKDALDKQATRYDKKDEAVDEQFWIYDKKNDEVDNQVWIYDKKNDAVDNQAWIYDRKNDAVDTQLWIYDKKNVVDNQFWIYDRKTDVVDNQLRDTDKKNDAVENQVWIYEKKNEAVDNQFWMYDKKNDAADNQAWMYDKQNDESQEMVGTGHTASHTDHIDPRFLGFFNLEDLKLGKTMFTKFPNTDPSSSLLLLPKGRADKIPFSLKEFPSILQFFPFSQESPKAKAMVDTLRKCEAKPIEGETKFCATSYESMLDFGRRTFGLQTNVKVLSTVHLARSTAGIQKYTIVKAPERISSPKMVACHTMPYPYTVFYCHYQESESHVYKVSLNGENSDRVEAIAVCHMNTSHWSPDHISFRVLGIEPGTSPVCHFFAANHHVLVPSASV